MALNLDNKGLKSIVNEFELFFIDIWGVLHNGINLFQNSIQVLNELEENQKKISATVFDPSGTQIIESTINQSSFEEIFDISEVGTYTLVIGTDSDEVINVVGGIGHVPDSSSYSISTAGFFILLSGMIGVVVLGILLVRERKLKSS